MPIDPAIRAAMRDARADFDAEFNRDEVDEDELFDAALALVANERPTAAQPTRFLTEGEQGALDEEDDEDDEDEGRPVKVKNPNLSNRLPREDFAPVIEFDDRPPLIDRCAEVLGERFKITKMGFLLDGKPANTDKVVAAAGLQYKDEEPMLKSPPTRQRKRRKKF